MLRIERGAQSMRSAPKKAPMFPGLSTGTKSRCRIRVSTAKQDYDAQLTEAGAQKVFAEKVTGTKSDRDQLKPAIAALDPGDVLIVTRVAFREGNGRTSYRSSCCSRIGGELRRSEHWSSAVSQPFQRGNEAAKSLVESRTIEDGKLLATFVEFLEIRSLPANHTAKFCAALAVIANRI
ncbi:recombinase family protein [Bradyrhizobium sp. UFLA01-814]|uniref:recombinase family protein n=1 Tax=Bradyrhizobium sp. UFLA01-814 TaxID=3023480 RepID=UPI00398ACF40